MGSDGESQSGGGVVGVDAGQFRRFPDEAISLSGSGCLTAGVHHSEPVHGGGWP